ncbi:hypothetical protein Tco_0646998 [Tanacetum coccineum]
MHQFWHTITKIKNSSSYKFKLDKKKCTIDVEVFCDILQICPRLPNQEFDAPSLDEDIVTFIKELGHKGVCLGKLQVLIGSDSQEHKYYRMRNSSAYKTYLAFATGAATPKKARKFKKPASPSKKKALVAVEELADKLKKAPTKAERSKGIELLFEDASIEEAQLKKAIKRSKQETNIHQAGGSSEGADLESEVLDKPKGKSIDTSKGTGLKPGVPDVSKADSFESEYESWGDSDDGYDDDDQQSDDESTESDDDKSADLNKTNDEEEDEFVHTPNDYVPTDDENLKDAEPANEEKGDEEMTHAENVNVEHKEVSQEVAGDQVKDNAQATVTADLATQKTKVPLQSSSISSNYATKFLNFDNIPSAPATTIPPPIPPFISLQQQSTPIPTPTTTEATTSTTVVPDTSSWKSPLRSCQNEVPNHYL